MCLVVCLGISNGMLPVKYFLSNNLCQLNFIEILKLSQNKGESDHPQFFGDVARFMMVLSACIFVNVTVDVDWFMHKDSRALINMKIHLW